MTAQPVNGAHTPLTKDLTKDDAAILHHFAAGQPVDLIALTTKLPRDRVAHVIDTIAKNDRMIARGLALELQRVTGVVASAPRPPDTLADLLDQAVRTRAPRLVRAAERIRHLAADLEKDLAGHARGQALRDEAAKLEKRLADIRRQLNPKRAAAPVPKPAAPPAGTAPLGSRAERQAVREWAAANRLDCPAKGRIPAAVSLAYRQAQRREDPA